MKLWKKGTPFTTKGTGGLTVKNDYIGQPIKEGDYVIFFNEKGFQVGNVYQIGPNNAYLTYFCREKRILLECPVDKENILVDSGIIPPTHIDFIELQKRLR